MIYIGGQKLKRCYLGEDKIGKVYLGDKLLFPKPPARHDLPDGYTELAYIQAVQGQIIDTGIKPSTQIKTVLDVEFIKLNTNAYLISSYLSKYLTGPVKDYYYFYYSANAYSASSKVTAQMGRYRNGLITSTKIGDLPHGRLTVTLNAKNFTASINDGEDVKVSGSSSYSPVFDTGMTNITLLNSSTSDTYQSTLKCYAAKIYSGENLVRDFMPCKNPEGVAGMYDLVNHTFYANAGSQNKEPFSPGPVL